MATTRLLSAEDIYDVYGLEWVLKATLTGYKLDAEDERLIGLRLREIRDFYVSACKSRIRAEARFLGINLEGESFSFEYVLQEIKNNIGKAMEQNAEKMMRGGGFNLMGHILSAHKAAGTDLTGINTARFGVGAVTVAPPKKDVDPNWFMDTKKHGGRVWEDPRWAEIAKAFVAIEAAHSDDEIIRSIDRINQLQHNSFHVLIDLQTGRMLNNCTNQTDDREARKRLQEVLNMKLEATSVEEFKDRMSPDVRKLLHKYRGSNRARK